MEHPTMSSTTRLAMGLAGAVGVLLVMELTPGLQRLLDPVNQLLVLLKGAGFLERTASEPPAYLPARDIETIHVNELLTAVRQAGETDLLKLDRVASPGPVNDVVDKTRAAVADELGKLSVRDLVLQDVESVATVHPLEGPAPGRLSS